MHFLNKKKAVKDQTRTGRRDCGEDDLPEEGQEVHDVVAAGRHLLLSLALAAFSFFLVVVTWWRNMELIHF